MIRFRAFPEQAGPQIKFYGLKGLITLEQVNTSVVEKRRMLMGKTSINSADSESNWSGVVNLHCMQMTLVLCVCFIFGDDRNDVPYSSRFFALWQWYVISLESRSLIFMYSYTCTQSIQKQIVKYDIKSKYPEEYLTIDKASKTYEYLFLNLQLTVTPLC